MLATGARPRRRRRDKTDPQFFRSLRDLIRAGGRRAAAADPDVLQLLVTLHQEVDLATIVAVCGLRVAGWTWDEIGRATGTTGQAATMKWLPLIREVVSADQGSLTRVGRSGGPSFGRGA